MEAVNLSQVSQTNFTNKQEVQKETPKAPEQKKNGIELLEKEANALALNAKASLTFTGSIDKLQNAIQDGIPKISNIKFFHGKAYSKADDKLFSGLVSDVLKNGDTIEMVYKDGLLQISERKGIENVLKRFIYSEEDERFLESVITKKPGVVAKAEYQRYSDGNLYRFITSENGREKINFEFFNNGKPRIFTKGEFFKSWDNKGSLSSMNAAKKITNLDGNEVEISLEIRDGKIMDIDCGKNYGSLYYSKRSGEYVFNNFHNNTTPLHLIEVLEKFGIENASEMIQELNLKF